MRMNLIKHSWKTRQVHRERNYASHRRFIPREPEQNQANQPTGEKKKMAASERNVDIMRFDVFVARNGRNIAAKYVAGVRS